MNAKSRHLSDKMLILGLLLTAQLIIFNVDDKEQKLQSRFRQSQIAVDFNNAYCSTLNYILTLKLSSEQ
jgi:hypothetical protein